jgi:hypothetical protein
MEQGKPVRRGLVIQGGGAKGAFALGCMKAFQEHGVDFAAVAGTSAGGLCAIIWSTGRVDEGIAAWKEIDHSGFFGRSPDGCLRRLIKVLCIAGKLFVSYVKGIEPEGQQQGLPRHCLLAVDRGVRVAPAVRYLSPLGLAALSGRHSRRGAVRIRERTSGDRVG